MIYNTKQDYISQQFTTRL